jgi:hypothetical protein
MIDKIRAGLLIMLWLVFCADWFLVFLLWLQCRYYDRDSNEEDNND